MDSNVEEDKFEATPITNFYSGKTVLITGGTGFLGSMLLGKMLTTCPVKRVYVLMKPKRGKNISQRMMDLTKSQVFEDVMKHNPSVLNNLIPVPGNIHEKNLGMSEEDITVLNKEVQVVFHSAANINMDTGLKDVIETNTKPTEELVKLCRKMEQLRVFVYISTAYSNCHRNLTDEIVYPSATNLKAIYDIYEELDRPENQVHRYQIMEKRPNTYTYSKSLAEKIIEDEIQGIPAVIVRPSIILSSIKSPMPGWTASKNLVNTIIAGVADGSLRCWRSIPEHLIDIVPVDHVANLLLAAAWDADKHRSNKVKVFHCCSGLQNPLTLGRFLSSCARISKKYSEKPVTFTINRYRSLHKIIWVFLQVIPAFVCDLISWLRGQPTRMLKKTAVLERIEEVLYYFVKNKFTFIDHNTRRIFREMDANDQRLFDFDISTINWESYLDTYVLGLRKF